jgi:3-hydroxybutyryl-CoA dehydrogenase
MGCGIAQVAAQAGLKVLVYDAEEGAAQRARAAVCDVLATMAAKGKLTGREADLASERIKIATDLTQLARVQLVIEAISEDLSAKRLLLSQIEAVVSADTILASNTSTLSISALAGQCKLPERVAGFHFFNPVSSIKVCEVVSGLLTRADVSETLCKLATRFGHTPIRVKDAPGTVVNYAGRALITESMQLLQENVAPFYEVDRILREQAGFLTGPFELLDLTGLDIAQPMSEAIYEQCFHEPRLRPSELSAQRLAGGLLGRKSGRGFYTFEANRALEAPRTPPPDVRPSKVWISEERPELAERLRQLVEALGAEIDTGAYPDEDSLCLVTPLGHDATTCCIEEDLDAARVVAIDMLFPTNRRRTLMTTPLTRQSFRDQAHGLFASDGACVSIIRDSAGMVAQRVVAQVVNIGCDLAQRRVANPEDIETAFTLGLGYARGPFAWAQTIGVRNVLSILDTMFDITKDPRYRPSPWLRRRALLEAPLWMEEA